MNLNLKRCEICKKGFDIGTNFDICPKCRLKINKEVEDGGDKRAN